MPNNNRPYLAHACAWCGKSRDPEHGMPELFRNVEQVDEHFVRAHGRDGDALQCYDLSLADVAAMALRLGLDIEEAA